MRHRTAAGALTALVLLTGCGGGTSPRAELREAAAQLNVEANEGDAEGLRVAAADLEAVVSRQSGEGSLDAAVVERLLALSKRVRANAKLLDRTAPAPVVSRTPTPAPTTEAPEPTTEAPEPTTEAPEPTTEAPEPTTEAPEPTTEAPQPTTEAPEPTTEAPEPTAEPTAPPAPTTPAATSAAPPASVPPTASPSRTPRATVTAPPAVPRA